MLTFIGKIAATLRRMGVHQRWYVSALGVIAVFGLVGLALITAGQAATVTVHSEAETGALSGKAAASQQAGASGGQAVVFGGGASTGGSGAYSVSANQRYLLKPDGSPFFYLGDTAWSMLVSLTPQEMTEYMTTRRDQGYTVIQASIFFNQNGTPRGTPYNGSVSNINESFFASQVDHAVAKAKELGLVLALHPAWADGQVGSALTAGNAQGYGSYLGKRYKAENHIIWAMGGDYPADGQESIWRNLAKGIAIGQTGTEDYSKQLMLYHPRGDQTSATWFRNDGWMDIIASQSGHCPSNPLPYDLVGADYKGSPAKPVIDFEPMYENHPYCWEKPPEGNSTALDVRKMAYWDVFSGGFGHAYGHHSVWPFVTGSHPFNSWGGGASGTWQQGLQAEGGRQMGYVRKLMESRPYQTGVPDQSLIVGDSGSVMGRKVASRASDGSYLMIYTGGGGFTADLSKLSGSAVKAHWFNPRTGQATPVNVNKSSSVNLTPPDSGDWVFVADDAARNFSAPGA